VSSVFSVRRVARRRTLISPVTRSRYVKESYCLAAFVLMLIRSGAIFRANGGRSTRCARFCQRSRRCAADATSSWPRGA
jgi:hypothetical protein